jgi:hypothetical protein
MVRWRRSNRTVNQTAPATAAATSPMMIQFIPLLYPVDSAEAQPESFSQSPLGASRARARPPLAPT